MNEFVEEMIARLDRLTARDAELRVFGADAHYHHRLAPLGEHEVQSIEDWLEVPLPAAYRHYVGHVSRGGIGPGYGLQWLPALTRAPCREDPRDEDAWANEAAPAMLRDDDERWARAQFPGLNEAAIEERIADLPEHVRASLRPTGDFTRTYEGRRNRYVLGLTSLTRDLARVNLELTRDDEFSSIPLCDYGCGMHAYLSIGALPPTVHVFDYEKETVKVIAPSFEAWMTDWLDETEAALDHGLKRKPPALWR